MVQEEFEEKKKMIEEFVGSKGYRSMSVKEMAMVLQVPSRDKKDFREVLDALAREGKISIDLKGKIKPLPADVKVGKYMATQRGFGFVRVTIFSFRVPIPRAHWMAIPCRYLSKRKAAKANGARVRCLIFLNGATVFLSEPIHAAVILAL